jgi:sugar phosphate isomerase/epimerase
MNVHPGLTLDEVEENLKTHLPPLKAHFAPDGDTPFGVGLRLAGEASKEALQGDRAHRLREWLDANGLYVFTMNGFPYGPFHGETVKGNVHAPDWRDDERVDYTIRLIDIMAILLPDDVADGSISTSPFTYKPWVDENDPALWETFVTQTVRVAEHLARVRQRTGKLIHVDLEPEPDGLLGDGAELIRFFEEWLLPTGTPQLAERLGTDHATARDLLLEHIRVCFDTCHVAVGYENPRELFDRFAALGIRVGKIQISSALKVDLPPDASKREAIARGLAAFDEPVYLHQVIQRNRDGSLTRYRDLPHGLEHIGDPDAVEWRIHFHVPVFLDHYESFGSTQETITETLALLAERNFTNHLEIETYTWDVLPADLKQDLGTSIRRELEWVLNGHA